MRLTLVTALLLAALAALPAAELAVTSGAEANPTGQPIGGGRGYTAGPKPSEADFRVDSLESLQRALV